MPEPQVVYDFDPNNLPPDYLQAIGLVIVCAAQTESIVGDFIGVLLDIDNIDALALTTQMSAQLRDHVARALIELKTQQTSIVDDVDDLLDAISQASDRRNTIAHAAFAKHPETGQIFSHRLRARGNLQLELKPISIEEIQAIAAEVYDAGMNLMQFMASVGLQPKFRTAPLMEPLNRKKAARTKRRNAAAAD
jgi:hypothetical protein